MAGLERARPALQPGWISVHARQIGVVLRLASWAWLILTASIVVARLHAIDLTPWGSVGLAALVAAPWVGGIVLSWRVDRRALRPREF